MVNYFEWIQLQLLLFMLFGFVGFEGFIRDYCSFLRAKYHLQQQKESLQATFTGIDEAILLGH